MKKPKKHLGADARKVISRSAFVTHSPYDPHDVEATCRRPERAGRSSGRADWPWAYHTTHRDLIHSIAKEGLIPQSHEHVEDGSEVVFVERDVDGLAPYLGPGMVVLRFKTPGFGSTEDGEDVLYNDGAPFVEGVIPASAIEILRGREWLPLSDIRSRARK